MPVPETRRTVTDEEWLRARKDLLAKEKEFTNARDELSRQVRAMPWRRVDRAYSFDSSAGKRTLADLFDGRSQLIVYHFMFDPEWAEGCPACSMMADHYDALSLHLSQRAVTMVTVSRARLEKIRGFKKRMGWTFEWVSSFGTSFNRDFHVSFTPEEAESGLAVYNYQATDLPLTEWPGISVFYRSRSGEVFHTYSSYARGLETFLGVYRFLDIVPQGRNEEGLQFSMAWVRHRDRYPDRSELHATAKCQCP